VKLLKGKRLKSVLSSGTQPCLVLGAFPSKQASVDFDRWKKAGGKWHSSGCVIALGHMQRLGLRFNSMLLVVLLLA
jgi:hypothetical protein